MPRAPGRSRPASARQPPRAADPQPRRRARAPHAHAAAAAMLRRLVLATALAAVASAAEPPAVAAVFAAPLRLTHTGFGEPSCAQAFEDGGALEYAPPVDLAAGGDGADVVVPAESFTLHGQDCQGGAGFRVIDLGVDRSLITSFIPKEALMYVFAPDDDQKQAADTPVETPTGPVCGVRNDSEWTSIEVYTFRAFQVIEAVQVATPNPDEGMLSLRPDVFYMVAELVARGPDAAVLLNMNCLLAAEEKTGGVKESVEAAEAAENENNDDGERGIDVKDGAQEKSSGLQVGAIAGIVVGVIALIAIFVAALTFSHVRKERARRAAFDLSSAGSPHASGEVRSSSA